MIQREENIWRAVVLLVGLCLLVRLPWAFIIPISEAPDEGAHYWVLNFIWNNGRLPGLADAALTPDAAYYGALATISYLPHLISAAVFRCFDPALAFRFGSMLMSVVAVIAACFIGRDVFPNSRVSALAVPLFLIFHPQLVFIGAYSNNDASLVAISSLLLLVCVRLVKYGLSSRLALALGALSGIEAILKPTGFCLFPTVALSVFLAVRMHNETRKNVLSFLSVAILLAAVVASAHFVKNMLMFEGDLLGTRTMLRLWEKAYGLSETMYPWPVVNHANWWYLLFVTFWGAFGNTDRLLPGWFYKSCAAISALAGVGYVVLICRAHRCLQQARANKLDRAPFVIMASCVLFNFVGVVISSAFLNSAGPAQGRYLFPSEMAFAVLVVKGLGFLPGRLRAIPVFVCLLLLAVGSVYGCTMLCRLHGLSLNIMR